MFESEFLNAIADSIEDLKQIHEDSKQKSEE